MRCCCRCSSYASDRESFGGKVGSGFSCVLRYRFLENFCYATLWIESFYLNLTNLQLLLLLLMLLLLLLLLLLLPTGEKVK